MKIVILGYSPAAESLLHFLSSDRHDVTVVHTSPDVLLPLQQTFDVQTMTGHPANSEVQRAAGITPETLVLALDVVDEVNLMASWIARRIFDAKATICRVHSARYSQIAHRLEDDKGDRGFISSLLDPPILMIEHICELLRHPGATEVHSFCDDRVVVVRAFAERSAWAKGRTVSDIHASNAPLSIVAIFRNNRMVPVREDAKIFAGDDITFATSRAKARSALEVFITPREDVSRIMVVGGGYLGGELGRTLLNELDASVAVIEKSHQQAARLAEDSGNSDLLVIEGDGVSKRKLLEEGIDAYSAFIAATNDDEDNIVACLMARHLAPATSVLCVMRDRDHADVMTRAAGVIGMSMSDVLLGEVLRHIHDKVFTDVATMRNCMTEIVEVELNSMAGSDLIGQPIHKVKLPGGVVPAVIYRRDSDAEAGKEGCVLRPAPDLVLEAGDRLVFLLVNRGQSAKLEARLRST